VIEFLKQPNNLPFLVAYLFMAIFGVFVLVTGGLGDHGDADVDVDMDADVSLEGDLNHDGVVSALEHGLGFLGFGKAPLMMLLVSFAWAFGSAGLVTQWTAWSTSRTLYPTPLAVAICIVPALLIHAGLARGISYFTNREDSSAVNSRTFLGKTATILVGETTKGRPTQAKFKDPHGQTHYVLVEPHREGDTFAPNDEVILVAQRGNLFEVMPTDIDILTDQLRALDWPKES